MTPPRTTMWTRLFGTREERLIRHCRRQVQRAFENYMETRLDDGDFLNLRFEDWQRRKSDLSYALEHYQDHRVEPGDAVESPETPL